MKEQEDKGDGKAQAQGKAQANIAIATRMSYNQIKDAGFLCFTVPYISHAMLSVTSYEYALCTINKVQSYLDLGDTRHFSGIKSDFTQLKHQLEPEVVHVANGQTMEAIGYSTIQLQTSYSKR